MRSLIYMLFCLLSISPLMAEERPLIILSHDRPPFHFKNNTGAVVGICVDIADTIFREMGIKYKIIDMNWARVWKKIETGKGEAAFSASRKKPREPYLFYPSTDMWRSEFVFFVHEANKHIAPNGTYKEVSDSGGKIGLWKGASYNQTLWEHYPFKDGSTSYSPNKINKEIYNEQFFIVSSPLQAFRMVEKQRIAFTLEDKSVGLYLIKQNDITEKVIPYDQPVFSKGYPMPFIKNSNYPNLEELAIEFETRLIAMKKDGRYQAIFERWLKP
ncbi:substrate-binding periplasmic protein [Neptuniibacter sp. QD37_6]|uniref:substrate-binding periplasmic protein n=1 Tax=Neptuniibacter sp. QD37_6 TaxID=3398210 RepID=UPI0039F5BA75